MWKIIDLVATILAIAAAAIVIWVTIIIPALNGWSVLLHLLGVL
jgi:hypothetical protein